jgi:hypothetical protein
MSTLVIFHHCDEIHEEINFMKERFILVGGFSPQLADSIGLGLWQGRNITVGGHGEAHGEAQREGQERARDKMSLQGLDLVTSFLQPDPTSQ